jgi:biuret amidohydrolase
MVPKLASTLNFCREKGIRVIYTAHVHRRDGFDMGLYDDLYSPIADRSTLVDGTKGVEIFPCLAPAAGEHIIKKHRYSAFFGTDLDIILREWGITTVIISGTTTENCCHATARDAMFNNYKVVFLSDATGSFDYPDVGYGAMSAEEVHKATLCILRQHNLGSSARTCYFWKFGLAVNLTADRHSAKGDHRKLGELPKQRAHPNLCGAPKTTFDVLKKTLKHHESQPAPDHTLNADRSPTGAVGELGAHWLSLVRAMGGPTQDPRSCLPWCGIRLATWN